MKTASPRPMPACALCLGLRLVLRVGLGSGFSVDREHELRFHAGCSDNPGLVLRTDGRPVTLISRASAPPGQLPNGVMVERENVANEICTGEGGDLSLGGRPTMFPLDGDCGWSCTATNFVKIIPRSSAVTGEVQNDIAIPKRIVGILPVAVGFRRAETVPREDADGSSSRRRKLVLVPVWPLTASQRVQRAWRWC
jgi:hypothetical protein